VRTRWPFIGRREELILIGETLGREPASAGLVVAGAAGVGKTSLLREAIRVVDAGRFLTREVLATPATSKIPFGALAHLLPAELPNTSNPTNLLRFAADALAEPAGSRRLVIGVDDAHVLDDTSAAVLHQLALTGRAFVLASLRAGETAPEAVTALWKDELVERVEVQSLSRGEVDLVLSTVLGADVDRLTVQRLWETTRGNMLFLRELVNAGLDSGALTELEGVWRWEGEWVMAPRLAELLTRRIGRLEPAEQHLLELLAYGAPIGLDTLADVVDLDVLQTAEAKNLLWIQTNTGHEEVHLAHPLYGEVLRSSCPALREMSRKRELADALESSSQLRDDDWLRIATWRLDSGSPVRPDVLLRALKQAWARFDLMLTDRLANAAIAVGVGVEAVQIQWRALLAAQRVDEVEELLAQWVLAPMSESERTDLVVGRAQNLFWGMDEPERGLAILRDAELAASTAGAAGAVESRERYLALRALLHAFSGDPQAAAEAVTGLAQAPIRDPWAAAAARAGQSVLGAMLGRVGEDTVAELDELRTVVEPWEGEPPFLGVIVDRCRFAALLDWGDLEGAVQLTEQAQLEAEDRNLDFSGHLMRVCRAEAERWLGHPRTARRLLREGVSRYRRPSSNAYIIPAPMFAELAHAESLCGRSGPARAALLEAERSKRKSIRVFDLYLELARPWVAAAGGDLQAAVQIALGVSSFAQQAGALATEMEARLDLIRLGSVRPAVDRLGVIAEQLGSPISRVVADYALAAVHKDGPGLDTAAAGLERLGADLLAAEAYALASTAYQAAGNKASSRAARTRSALILDRCEGAITPAVEAISSPRLTPRERAIAKLASQGMSNKEIAERFVLSKRTVDNHLHQIYGKLGISGRGDLRHLPGDI
jgi:DNA-binding CsgD family transcriptional regulator